MKVLICGSRGYQNQKRVFQVLDEINEVHPIELIIEGGAEGADRQGRYWALAQGVPCMTIHAPWDRMGPAAGPTRNEWMIKYGRPDLCLAFPGGRGTESMKKIALRHEVEVRAVEA